MKAILYSKYGPPEVLQLREVEKPIPKDNEVLIQVQAASINSLDWHFLRGSPSLVRLTGSGVRKPKDPRLGVDVAGLVEAVGSKVTQFQPGDAVFGRGVGSFAEYACAQEDALVMKPATMTSTTAAAIPIAALTALQGLRDHGHIQSGQQVLIQGASGGVGTFAVQLAKSFGAEVTAVCSTKNIEMVRSLGADQVIDYTQEDVTRKDRRYDLILAVNGYHSLAAYRRVLRPHGIFVMIGALNERLLPAMFQVMLLGKALSRANGQKIGSMLANPTRADLSFVSELVEAGKVTPVIDRCYPLSETAEAFHYFEVEHARGKIVITVAADQLTQ